MFGFHLTLFQFHLKYYLTADKTFWFQIRNDGSQSVMLTPNLLKFGPGLMVEDVIGEEQLSAQLEVRQFFNNSSTPFSGLWLILAASDNSSNVIGQFWCQTHLSRNKLRQPQYFSFQ